MKSISYIRHAESLFNKDPNDNTPNCGLTSKGIEQAKNLVGQYDCVFISPLKRAKETLKWSRIECENVIETDILREVRRDPCDFLENEIQIMETIDEVIERAKKATLLINRSKFSKVAVLAHWEIIWYMTNYEIDLENSETKKYLTVCLTV